MYKFRVTYKVDGKIHKKVVYAAMPSEILSKIVKLYPQGEVEVTSVRMAN